MSDKPTSLKRKEVLELFDNKDNFEYVHEVMANKVNFEDFE